MTTSARLMIATGVVAAVLCDLGCSATNSLMGGRGRAWPLTGGDATPAANGQVTVKTEDDGNQSVEVTVDHLAPPARAFEGASAYVVWIRPTTGGPAQNMGALALDSDLKGSLKIRTPFQSFELLITAETDIAATEPSNNRVMGSTINTAA